MAGAYPAIHQHVGYGVRGLVRGRALYDHFGFYAPAFGAGALFNLANLVVIGFLVTRQARQSRLPAVLPA